MIYFTTIIILIIILILTSIHYIYPACKKKNIEHAGVYSTSNDIAELGGPKDYLKHKVYDLEHTVAYASSEAIGQQSGYATIDPNIVPNTKSLYESTPSTTPSTTPSATPSSETARVSSDADTGVGATATFETITLDPYTDLTNLDKLGESQQLNNKIVQLTLSLKGSCTANCKNITYNGVPGKVSYAKDNFKLLFKETLATLLNITPDRINVLGIVHGSIKVNFELLPSTKSIIQKDDTGVPKTITTSVGKTTAKILTDLHKLIQDPDSLLYDTLKMSDTCEDITNPDIFILHYGNKKEGGILTIEPKSNFILKIGPNADILLGEGSLQGDNKNKLTFTCKNGYWISNSSTYPGKNFSDFDLTTVSKATCDTASLICSTEQSLLAGASAIYCNDETCVGSDNAKCCEANDTCDKLVLLAGQQYVSEHAKISCKAKTCSQGQDTQCFEELELCSYILTTPIGKIPKVGEYCLGTACVGDGGVVSAPDLNKCFEDKDKCINTTFNETPAGKIRTTDSDKFCNNKPCGTSNVEEPQCFDLIPCVDSHTDGTCDRRYWNDATNTWAECGAGQYYDDWTKICTTCGPGKWFSKNNTALPSDSVSASDNGIWTDANAKPGNNRSCVTCWNDGNVWSTMVNPGSGKQPSPWRYPKGECIGNGNYGLPAVGSDTRQTQKTWTTVSHLSSTPTTEKFCKIGNIQDVTPNEIIGHNVDKIVKHCRRRLELLKLKNPSKTIFGTVIFGNKGSNPATNWLASCRYGIGIDADAARMDCNAVSLNSLTDNDILGNNSNDESWSGKDFSLMEGDFPGIRNIIL